MSATTADRPLQFGTFPTPEATADSEIVRAVALAEQGGLDLVGLQDHPYQRRFLENVRVDRRSARPNGTLALHL